MKMWRGALCLMVCLSLAACSSTKAEPEAPSPDAAPLEASEEVAKEEAAPSLDAEAPADDCIAKCLQNNQMRAVGPEQIEADCKRACAQ
jgi:hypothetical protein